MKQQTECVINATQRRQRRREKVFKPSIGGTNDLRNPIKPQDRYKTGRCLVGEIHFLNWEIKKNKKQNLKDVTGAQAYSSQWAPFNYNTVFSNGLSVVESTFLTELPTSVKSIWFSCISHCILNSVNDPKYMLNYTERSQKLLKSAGVMTPFHKQS